MAHSGICCGLFRGRFYIRNLNVVDAPLLPVGNAEAEITQSLTDITQPNYQSLGGNNCKVSYVESVNLNLTLHCTSPENVALGFAGSWAKLTAGAVVDELHDVNAIHELIALNFVPIKASIVVTKAAVTYVAGVDYVVTNAGIEIIEGSTILVDGTPIEISYSYGANYKVDAQTIGQQEYEVVLDGVNVGEDGDKQIVLKAWKVKFAPTDSFALISGTDFASLNLAGEVLRDDSKATGSKYMTIEWGV